MIDIAEYLSDLGISFRKQNENNISTVCPWCGDNTGRFTISVNPRKPVFNCWRGRCEEKGGWVKLLVKLEGVSYEEAHTRVYGGISLDSNANEKTPEKNVEVVLPTPFGWTRSARNYLRSRHVDDEQAASVRAYYCNSYPYENRIIFPITQNGSPVSFQARAIDPKAQPRYRFPKGDMGHFLYNYDGIKKGEVILVEGIFDALRLMRDGLNVVATFGKRISDIQIGLLKEKGISEVCVLYDADAAKQYESISERLNPYFNISYCLLFGGDPAECKNLDVVLASRCESLDDFYQLQFKRRFGNNGRR